LPEQSILLNLIRDIEGVNMQEKFIKEIGRCIDGFDVIKRGNFLLINGQFSYESGNGQGMGWIIDQEFITSFLSAFGVSSFKETKGKLVYVTHSCDIISRIDPIFKEDGKPFDIVAWSENRRNISDQQSENRRNISDQ
jgi:hypothetical protein